MFSVEVLDVYKRIGNTWIIRGASFKSRQHEVVAITGPNGSGKSTLLKLIAGIWSPSRGKIKVLGKDPQSVSTRGVIGYVPHESLLYDELTVLENLRFYSSFYENTNLETVIDLLDLREVLHRKVSELSFGWRRRVDIARAAIHSPKLLIIDEPLTGLDERGKNSVLAVIKEHLKIGTVLVASPTFSEEFTHEFKPLLVTINNGAVSVGGS